MLILVSSIIVNSFKNPPYKNCPVPRMGSAFKPLNVLGLLEVCLLEVATGVQKDKYAKQELWVVVCPVKGITLTQIILKNVFNNISLYTITFRNIPIV